MSGILDGVGSIEVQATTITKPLTIEDIRRVYALLHDQISHDEIEIVPTIPEEERQLLVAWLERDNQEAERIYRRHGGQKKKWKYSGKHPLDVAAEVER